METQKLEPPKIDKAWVRKLQLYLINLLMKHLKIDDREKALELCNKDRMGIWVKTFTNPSFYSTKISYEREEYQGDRILKSIFALYLANKFPGRSEEKYSQTEIKYMSATKQNEYARELNLIEHVRVGDDFDKEKITFGSDIYEAFIAGLFNAANASKPKKTPFYGYKVAYIFLANTVPVIDIERDGQQSYKTQITQIFNKFNFYDKSKGKYVSLTAPKIETEISGETVKAYLRLNSLQLSFLSKTFPKKEFDEVIGLGVGKNLMEASNIAYENAIKYLNKRGLNLDKAREMKYQQIFRDPKIKPLVDVVEAFLQKNGYTKLSLDLPKKLTLDSDEQVVIQISSSSKEGDDNLILGTRIAKRSENSKNYPTAMTSILRDFILKYDLLEPKETKNKSKETSPSLKSKSISSPKKTKKKSKD